MSPREPSNPIALINDRDQDAFLATLSPDATLTNTAARVHSPTGSIARSSPYTIT
jgi:hypothetical protein